MVGSHQAEEKDKRKHDEKENDVHQEKEHRNKEMSKQKKNAKKPAASKAAGKNKTIKSQRQTAVKSVTKNCQKPKRKNVSQKIPNGRTLQTRDEFFEGQEKYRKPGYENKGLYRKVVVVDSNRADELAVVKLTTSKQGTALPDYQQGKSKYRPFVATKDDENKPIKVGKKFLPNKPQKDVSQKDVNQIKKDSIKRKDNRKKLRELKGRK